MKIVICNSKKWFKLDKQISKICDVTCICKPDDLTFDTLEILKPDLIFFPHWSWIVDESIFLNFECILFHTAPLPFGRGGSPIQNLIINGYKNAPVCALKMGKGVDSGPIYYRKSINLEGSLSDILKRLNKVVNGLIKKLINKLPVPKPQEGEIFTFKRLNKQDNMLKPEFSLEQIYDRIRMVDDENYPNSYLDFGNVVFEFSKILKKGDEITCKVRLKEKE